MLRPCLKVPCSAGGRVQVLTDSRTTPTPNGSNTRASYVTQPSPLGHGYFNGYLVHSCSADSRSELPAKLPGIIVVHENRGLNPMPKMWRGACVPFYGAAAPVADVPSIKAAILIQHGELDTRLVDWFNRHTRV